MPGQLAGRIAVLTPSPPIVTRLHTVVWAKLPPAVDVGDRRVDQRRRVVRQQSHADLGLVGAVQFTGGMIL